MVKLQKLREIEELGHFLQESGQGVTPCQLAHQVIGIKRARFLTHRLA